MLLRPLDQPAQLLVNNLFTKESESFATWLPAVVMISGSQDTAASSVKLLDLPTTLRTPPTSVVKS